ncbi:MAG: hypothetical protein NVV60_01630 [Luteimonas sp.]|nr:hypothetical protein [Luteimonas sp.]
MNTDAIYARAKAAFTPAVPDLIQRGNADIEASSIWNPPGGAGHRMPAGFDPRLKPTWRVLRNQLRVFNGPEANHRAERLVLRFMDREWPADRLEALLTQLIARGESPRSERRRTGDAFVTNQTRLAQAHRAGSAGQCPAPDIAKTPAGQKSVCLVEAAPAATGATASPTRLSNRSREAIV